MSPSRRSLSLSFPRASAEPTPRYPILAILLARCALAASGPVTMLPPIRVMNTRRSISLGSLDDLVCPPEHRRRDRQTERLSGLEVDHQLELRRLLDGQVAGVGTLQNLVHVGSGAPRQVSKVRSIGHQAPDIDILAVWEHRRQPVLCRQVHEASSLTGEHGGWQHGQSTRARPGHVQEGPVELGGMSRLHDLKLHPQRPRRDSRGLDSVVLGTVVCLHEKGDSTHIRNGLLEQLQPLADEFLRDNGEARDIAARPPKAGDESARNRITDRSEDDGKGRGRLLGGEGGGCVCDHDDINLESNEVGHESGEPLEVPPVTSVFDHDVAALDITEITQSLAEGLALEDASGPAPQVAYASDLGRLLALRGERRKNTESEHDREPDPPHEHLGWDGWRESRRRWLDSLTDHADGG